MSKSVFGDLVAARELIADPQDWRRGFGEPDGSKCAVHAVRVACNFDGNREVDAINTLAKGMRLRVFNGPRVGAWNDSHKHHEVIAAFNRAIAALAPPSPSETK